jgi:hypothetical protein
MRDKFIRINATETAALDRVLTRICAGNDHVEAVILQRVLERLRKVWLPSPRRTRRPDAHNSNHEGATP